MGSVVFLLKQLLCSSLQNIKMKFLVLSAFVGLSQAGVLVSNAPANHFQAATAPADHFLAATAPADHFSAATAPAAHFNAATAPADHYTANGYAPAAAYTAGAPPAAYYTAPNQAPYASYYTVAGARVGAAPAAIPGAALI